MIEKLKEFFRNFWTVINRPEMAVLPGQLAFFFVLSVVPIITLISYGASFLNLPIDFIGNFLTKAFSAEISSLIVPEIIGTAVSLKFLISMAIGYFFASNGASSIIVTSNTIYGIKNSNWLKRRIKAIVMTFFIVLLFLFILIVPVFGDKIIEMIRYVNLNENISENIALIFNILKGPISWFIIFLFIKIIYTMAPDRKMPSANVNYGAVFTSVLWILATAIYSYYVTNFANYGAFYGALSNIVVLMLWVYLLAYIFTIGMALNYREEEIKLEKTGTMNLSELDNNK